MGQSRSRTAQRVVLTLVALLAAALPAVFVASARASDTAYVVKAWGWGVLDGTAKLETCTTSCQYGLNGGGAGELYGPQALATDDQGYVYVVDFWNDRIDKFSTSGSFVEAWGWGVADGASQFETCTTSCQAGVAGPGAGELDNPEGIAVSGSDVYVADYSNERIDEFTTSGSFVEAFGWGVVPGAAGFDVCTSVCQVGQAGGGAGEFYGPNGVATDSSGDVYVADYYNNRVDEFSSTPQFIGAWGWGVADGTSQFEACTSSCQGGVGGSGAGELQGPDAIAVNGSGDVYVTDNYNARVSEFSDSGSFVQVWGWGVANGASQFETCTSACEGGLAGGGAGQLNDPAGLGTDSSGDVYVADGHNERIDQFTSDGAFVEAWGWGVADGHNAFETCTSSCQAGVFGSGAGQFGVPAGVATDSSGNVYVGGNENDRIDEFGIGQPPAITSGSHTTFTTGNAGSFTVTSTGVPTASLSESGALPSGVSFIDNGNGTASLSGTPAAGSGGVYPLTLYASNGVGVNASRSFTLTVDQAPAITSANHTTFTVGSAGSFTVTSSGYPTPSVCETGTLPSGVTFHKNGNGTATLLGTPAAGSGGTYAVTITASNGVGSTATQLFTLTVDNSVAITSASSTTFVVGTPGSFPIDVGGYPPPSLSESGTLPSGVTFHDNGNGTGALSGTPAAGTGGVYPLTIRVSNGVGSPASQPFTLTVKQAPAISSADAATFMAGSAGSFTVTSGGYPTASLSESGALPSGVSFQDNGNGTGTLSGTPAAGSGGVYDLTITPANGVGSPAGQPFTLTVDGLPGVVPSPPAVQSTSGAAFAGSVDPEGLPTTAYFEYGIDLSERGPGSSTNLYDQTTPVQVVGSDSADHPVFSSAAGLQPNALYHVRLVATNSAGTTVGPDQTFITAATATAPPPPVLGKAVDVAPVSGHVFILLPPGTSLGTAGDAGTSAAALPKGQAFIPLTEARQIPTGSEIDALNGSLKMVSNTGKVGKTQTATLAGGVFKLTQVRKGISKGLTTFKLVESAFQGAPSYGLCKAKTSTDEATIAKLSTKTLQLLKVSGHGKFQTTGRYSSATVRGTIYTVADRCDGTLTHVIRDTVLVDDFVRHKKILLRSGQSYLASAITSRK
jgi:hypothetical protein